MKKREMEQEIRRLREEVEQLKVAADVSKTNWAPPPVFGGMVLCRDCGGYHVVGSCPTTITFPQTIWQRDASTSSIGVQV